MPRERVRLAHGREQMKVQRKKRFERRLDRAKVLDGRQGVSRLRADAASRQAAIQMQSSADDLDERAERRDVAKCAAAAFDNGSDRPSRRQTLLQLVQEPALPDAGLTDNLDHEPVAAARGVDVT